MAGGALQVVGQRPVVLVTQSIFDQLGDELANPTELRVPKRVFGPRVGNQTAVGIGKAFGNSDRAIAVQLDAFIDTGQETLSIEVHFREQQDMRRLAGTFGSQATGGGNPTRVAAQHFHDKNLGRSPGHRSHVVAGFANRGCDILGHRTEPRATISMRQIVVDRLRHPDANNGVAHLLGNLRHLPGGIHGIVAAVVEEVTDIVRLEYLDQALVLGLVLLKALQLVAAGTEGSARRVPQAGDIGIGFEAGIDQVFGQGTDNAIAPGIDFPDLVGMAACFLDQAARRGVDDGRNAPRLSVEGIFDRHFFTPLFQGVENALGNCINAADTGNLANLRCLGIAFGGPLAVEVDQRLGLRVVDFEALLDGFFLVVIALNQVFTGHVILALDVPRVELDVVGTARRQVGTATGHALDDVAVRHVDFEHEFDRHTGILHGLSLRNGARETVEQVAVLAVVLGQAILDHADDDSVRHQAARVHVLLGFEAKRGAGLDLSAQHVAGGNLRDAELLADESSLRSLTGARSAQQNQFHEKSLWFLFQFWFVILVVTRHGGRSVRFENYSLFPARSNSLRIRLASSGVSTPGAGATSIRVTLMR